MTAWSVLATPEAIEQFRQDDAFAELLTLGRVANLLRAVLAAGFALKAEEGSAASRDRNAFFLLLTGILAEAFPALERSAQSFRHLTGWQEQIRPLLASAEIQQLRADFLLPIRNQAVFHNDASVSEKGLAAFQPPEPQAIARGCSDGFMDMYYPMSDMVAVVFIANQRKAGEDTLAWLADALSRSIALGTSICTAIDVVAGQALDERGFTWESPDAPAG